MENIFEGPLGPLDQGEFQSSYSVHLSLNTHLIDLDPKAIQGPHDFLTWKQKHILTLAEKLSKKIIFVFMASVHKWSQTWLKVNQKMTSL